MPLFFTNFAEEPNTMILIADGGSTKCDWVLLDRAGEILLKTNTKGINPSAVSENAIAERLVENPELQKIKTQVDKVHFYGAGCGTNTPKQRLQNILEGFFLKAREIQVMEDLTVAVRAVTTQPGIVCILGTGSNSCYFDGEKITTKIPSLGYILMDEASGNYFGKALLKDCYYGKMPIEIAEEFKNKYDLSPDSVKENLYDKENPRAYLGSFAEFIFGNENNPYFHDLVSEGIRDFIKLHVLCFEESKTLPIHFVGSIAFFAQDTIREVVESYGLKMGNILRRPIDGLTVYYQNRLKNVQEKT